MNRNHNIKQIRILYLVWITMSLCWSANAQIFDKQKFPYRHAALLSSQLWMKMTPAKIIMQIGN